MFNFSFAIPTWLPALDSLVTHLWESTLFALATALLTLLLRKNQARWRCVLWLAASVKFLVPFSLLIALGHQLEVRPSQFAPQPMATSVIQEITTLARPPIHRALMTAPPAVISMMPVLLLTLWLGGSTFVLLRWGLAWRRIRTAVRKSTLIIDGRELLALRRAESLMGGPSRIRMLASASRLEPGVFGLWRQVLLWPAGISEHLADEQIEAVLAHEICHARRRDNLTAAVQMLVETIFWFHPLVWWLGARLVHERENACDEEVIRLGNHPRAYAESILKTCQFFLESPMPCMAGVTGSDLKKRIEKIMSQRVGSRLDWSRKLLLAAAGIAAVLGPVAFGVFTAPVHAQSSSDSKPAFEAASIKPNNSGDHQVRFQITPGRLSCSNASPKMLITMSYNLKPHQIEGGPSWLDTDRYDINAKSEGTPNGDQVKAMVQSLLAERFQLTFHREKKDMPVYALTVAKGGFKLHPIESSGEVKSQFRMGRGQIDLAGADMRGLADALGNLVGRNIIDQTGITGFYNIKLEWTPGESEAPMFKGPPDGKEGASAPEATGPSVFTAIQEQLGLKLESQKGPVDLFVIDHIEKPSEN